MGTAGEESPGTAVKTPGRLQGRRQGWHRVQGTGCRAQAASAQWLWAGSGFAGSAASLGGWLSHYLSPPAWYNA